MKLEELSGESKQQLVVVSPMWAGIDGTVHALSTQLRTYAPSIVSLSAIERYPVEENSKVYGYDQTKYDEFLNNPTENSVRRFEKEIDKYEIFEDDGYSAINNSVFDYAELRGRVT